MRRASLDACGFYRVNKIDFDCNLGYWVHESHLGQGAAVEAVRQIRNFAFQETGLVGLEIFVAQTSLASRLVAEKARAIVDGPRRAIIRMHGASYDAGMYALINLEANRYREDSDR